MPFCIAPPPVSTRSGGKFFRSPGSSDQISRRSSPTHPSFHTWRTHGKTPLASLQMLEVNLFHDLERFPAEDAVGSLTEERKLLCVSIGKLNGFLQDTLGELVAADPRSMHDADYFLSRKFPRDIEEAEWLYASVQDLRSYLRDIERVRYRRLTEVI